jgi:hypothetical protein
MKRRTKLAGRAGRKGPQFAQAGQRVDAEVDAFPRRRYLTWVSKPPMVCPSMNDRGSAYRKIAACIPGESFKAEEHLIICRFQFRRALSAEIAKISIA